MVEQYKPQLEEMLNSLPYKVNDKVYRFTQNEIREYLIRKIELSFVSVHYHNCVHTTNELKITITIVENGVGGECYELADFKEKFSSTPLLVVEKIKKDFLRKMDDILEKYKNK